MASKSAERSWNDPPVLKFEINAPVAKPQLLNKRVFSSLNKEETTQTSVPSIAASSTLPQKDIIKNVNIVEVSTTAQSQIDGAIVEEKLKTFTEDCDIAAADVDLTFVTTTFKNILHESPGTSEKTLKEINRRIKIMEELWDSALSPTVKHKTYKLAEELSNGEIDAALKIHCSLMVENVREVKNWMVGVKHIIEMKREKQNSSNAEATMDEQAT